jgi:hypothetical protein
LDNISLDIEVRMNRTGRGLSWLFLGLLAACLALGSLAALFPGTGGGEGDVSAGSPWFWSGGGDSSDGGWWSGGSDSDWGGWDSGSDSGSWDSWDSGSDSGSWGGDW